MIHLDITMRNCEELHERDEEIMRLNAVLISKEQEIHRMSDFAVLYLNTLDQLKRARAEMKDAGLDVSWIRIRGG